MVIHPKYRTIGLGTKIIHEALPIVATIYVELIAVMAKYSPSAEKAGMRKIVEQESVESVSDVSMMLTGLGFDLPTFRQRTLCQRKTSNSKSCTIRQG